MVTYNDGADYIQTSIRGRRLGLDKYDIIRGVDGYGDRVESLTSADAGATLSPGGLTVLNAGASSTGWILPSPSAALIGVEKKITNIAAYTNKVTLAAGAFGTSTGTASATVLTSTGIGQSVVLQYVSTAVVQVLVNTGTVTFA